MISVQVNGKEICKLSSLKQVPFHHPSRGDKSWKIIDEDTGEVLASYAPHCPRKNKPEVGYERSWDEKQAAVFMRDCVNRQMSFVAKIKYAEYVLKNNSFLPFEVPHKCLNTHVHGIEIYIWRIAARNVGWYDTTKIHKTNDGRLYII